MEFLNLWHPLALGSFLLAVSRSRCNDLIIINQSDVQKLVETNEVPVNCNRESELAEIQCQTVNMPPEREARGFVFSYRAGLWCWYCIWHTGCCWVLLGVNHHLPQATWFLQEPGRHLEGGNRCVRYVPRIPCCLRVTCSVIFWI